MEIKKETTIIPMTTDNKPLHEGDKVVFTAEDKCFCGKFLGISKKGAVMFEGIIAGEKVTFNVMPRSIKHIYLAEITVDCEVSG